jgi:ribosomal protein L19
MNSDYIKNLEASQMKTEVADFAVGDTVKVHNKIKEGNRESRFSKELLLRDRVEATERLSQLESSQTVLA